MAHYFAWKLSIFAAAVYAARTSAGSSIIPTLPGAYAPVYHISPALARFYKRVLGPPHEIREVQNAAEAYALMQSLNPLSEDDLLKAHRLMMNSLVKEAGRFRSGGVGVMAGNQVIHMAPPAHLVPWQIKDLFTWYQESDLHPLVKSSIFHYEFEFIHPFADGNGRIGRMWHTLLLAQWKSFFAWLPIEELIAKRQSEYYKALQMADDACNCSCFVTMMLEVIRDVLQEMPHATDAAPVDRPSSDQVDTNRTRGIPRADRGSWF